MYICVMEKVRYLPTSSMLVDLVTPILAIMLSSSLTVIHEDWPRSAVCVCECVCVYVCVCERERKRERERIYAHYVHNI